MKQLFKIFSFLCAVLAIFENNNAFAQSVSANVDQNFFSCGGGSVQLDAIGTTASNVFGDSFNGGALAPGWSSGPAADFTNPCGTALDGTTYLWMGSSTSAPRNLTTTGVDVTCGGTVCFDFKFMCEYCGDTSPCEGADFYNEGVSLQYSTNGGTTWTDISYFAPNGNLLTNYPGAGASAPIAFGSTNFTTWANYCFPIPAGGFSANTNFRLSQWGSSGNNFDHWGIDNFYITSNQCNPFYYDWAHIPGSPDAAGVTANVTQTTTFTVNYTDGTTSYTDQVTVVVDNLDIDVFTVTPSSCYGAGDASASITLLNGQAPISFDLSGPTSATNSTGTFTGLTAGLYVLTVTDDDGCTLVENFVMPQGPSCCTVSATGVDPTCNGFTNGSIQATPSGGIPSYTYQWYDLSNTPIAGQVYQSIGNIGAGTYIIEVTDASGCVSRDTVELIEPLALSGTLTTTQLNCFGVCDASIDMTNTSGGTVPYEYALNNNNYGSTSLFDNLCQGNYTYKVRDANGCELSITEAILQPTNLIVSTTSNTNEICSQVNGEFEVQASGGIGPYTYDNGVTTNSTGIFTGLAAGLYPVIVTDMNGCTKNIDITVVNTPAPNPVVDYQQDVACAGGQNGAVVVAISISTGTAPFTYDLDMTGPVPTNTFNVNQGLHTIDVLDANNCGGSVSFTIGQPLSLAFTTVKTDAICNAACNGTITVSASGGTPPYQYSKNSGTSYQNSNVLTGLCAGNVDVVVKDANGCFANANITINEPTAMSSSNTSVDPTCFNGCDGSISFGLTTGGIAPYEYSINNGGSFQTSPFFTNLCAGTHDIITRDDNNCEFLIPNVVLNNPLQIQFNDILEVGSNCGFANGGFEVQAINGTAPYDYSLDPTFATTQPSGSFLTLPSGLYTVYVEDDNGCIDSTSEDVSDLEIVTNLDSTRNVTCYGGTDGGVFVNVLVGLAPYEFTLDSVYFQTTGTFDGAIDPSVQLAAGTHFVIIHDSGNCSDYYEFTITEPDSITYNIAQVNTSCLTSTDGEITFNNVNGGDGGPYMYSIDNGLNFQPGNVYTGLAAGTYNTIVQDGNGCLGAMTVEIIQPTKIEISINPTDLVCHGDNSGILVLSAIGGAGGYNYDIGTANNTSGIHLNLAAGLYNISVTDANGCIEDTTYTLTEPDTLGVALAVTDNICFADCNGIIDVTAVGGTLPYLYSANAGVNQQASSILSNLCSALHTVEVEDFRGCVYTINQTIVSPPNLTIALAGTATTCGNNNGTITVTANGGTPVYSYQISDDNGVTYSAPVLSNTFLNLQPNFYIIKVVDDNLCEVEASIVISADNEPTIDFVQTTDILCNGETTGEIDITSGLGVGVHEYSIDNINYFTANVFSNLGAGNYDVYVRDGNNCIVQSTTAILEPALLVSNAAGTNLVCNNDFSGNISIIPTGGTPNLLYSIDNGITYQPFGIYDNLAANTYNTIVQDANACADTVEIIISEPTAITAAPALTSVSCFGACDGAIDLQSAGGTGTLSYQWTGNIAAPTSMFANNVCAGDYNAIITDANGCFLEQFNLAVTEPPQLVINSASVTNVSCFGLCDGEIEIDAPLGVSYDIIYNAVTTTNVTGLFTALCPGSYEIIVTDVQGCQVFSNTSITEPDVLVNNPPSDWTNVCFNSSINISPGYTSGGTLPYTYNWIDAFMNAYPATTTFTQVATVDNSFTYDLVDANGCTAGPFTFSMTVTPPLSVTASPLIDSICPGDEITLFVGATGGQLIDLGDTLDYLYSWNTSNPSDTLTSLTVSPNQTVTNYSITVTDYCNEVITENIIITLYPDATPVLSTGDTSCAPYYSRIENINDVGGTTNWTFSNGITHTGQNADNILFAEPTCYDVTVSVLSENGCSGDNFFPNVFCVNPLPKANFEFSPLAPRLSDNIIDFTNLSQGAEFYTWDFGRNGRYGVSNDSAPSFIIPFTEETNFMTCLAAESNFGCIDTFCQFINVQEDLLFYVPNTFTPDDGSINSYFKPVFTSGFDPYQYQLLIFNRWGEIIFESRDPNEGWDGRYANNDADQAAYIWKIIYEDTYEDIQKTASGHVTLLR
ncbi:MAG: T9SS type B sorting domain-containing protein [Crocinitomicaceae bacterium]